MKESVNRVIAPAVELCILTQNAALCEAMKAAAQKAGVSCTTMHSCETCDVRCKPIVAVDIADPQNINSVSCAHGKGGGRVLIAIAPATASTVDVKERGYQFVVYDARSTACCPLSCASARPC